MSLPIISEFPTKQLKLPLSGLEIKYRPFLVKEEKNLMFLRESKDVTPSEIFQAVSDTLNACTFGKIEVLKLPASDLEFLFMRVRAFSKGETSELVYRCRNQVEEGKICGNEVKFQINLDSIEPTIGENIQKSFDIPKTDIKIHMKFPTAQLVFDLDPKNQKHKMTEEDVLNALLFQCVESISQGERVMTEFTKEELSTFFDQVPSIVFEKIRENFLDKMPRLQTDLNFECDKCGHHEVIHLEGIQDFFS